MKAFIVIFSLFVAPFAFSQDAAPQGEKPPSVDEMVSYIDRLVAQEQEPVTCANVLDAIKEYFDLSQTNQNLLAVSSKRLLRALPSGTERTPEETEALSEDITRAVHSIENSQEVFSEKAFNIMEALPGCLKE